MDLPKFHPNERVDLGDVEFISTGQLGEHQRLFTALIAGEATKRIIDGFTFTIQSATVLQIGLGKAVLVENRNAALRYGQLTGGGNPVEGPAAQNVSFSGLPVATHGVYVRFVYGDGTVANRAFWDTITNVEQIQAVNTRKVASWQVTVAQNNPGDEWYKVVDVTWNGADLATSTITDRRTFLFEGPADSTPQTFRPSWGGGNDRNADRATHGVKTLERFASAVLKKLEEIQSDTPATRWWSAPVEPLDKKVSRFGDSSMAGDYVPDVSGRDLGTTIRRWDAWLANVDVSGSLMPLVTGGAFGEPARRWDAAIRTLDLNNQVFYSHITGDWTNAANNVYVTSPNVDFTGASVETSVGTSLDVRGNLNVLGPATVFNPAAALAVQTQFIAGATFRSAGIGTAQAVTKAAVSLSNTDPTTGTEATSAILSVPWRMAANDGFDLFAWRAAAGDPRLTLRNVVAGVAGSSALEIRNAAVLAGKAWTFSSDMTTESIVPSGSGKNLGAGDAVASRYALVYCDQVRAGTGFILNPLGTPISLVAGSGIATINGPTSFYPASPTFDAPIRVRQDYDGADEDTDTSIVPGGVATDVGVMATFRADQARVATTVSPVFDRPLHIATQFAVNGQCGAIKVRLVNADGTVQTRGFIRVWFTPVGS